MTIYDLAKRVKRLTGCPGEIVFEPLHYADVEIRIPNVEKARELLGFEAKVDLDEGLERTIAWYRAVARLGLSGPRGLCSSRPHRRRRRPLRDARAHGAGRVPPSDSSLTRQHARLCAGSGTRNVDSCE